MSRQATPTAEELLDLVANQPLFSHTARESLETLSNELNWVPLDDGEALFQRGVEVDSLYLLTKGILDVIVTKSDGEEFVARELGAPSAVGEMQILHGGQRSATVQANDECELVRVTRDAFVNWLQSDKNVLDDISNDRTKAAPRSVNSRFTANVW